MHQPTSIEKSATRTKRSLRTSDRVHPKKSKVIDPIVWAVDPVERDVERLKPLARAINLWRKADAAPVLPVSVLSPVEIKWPMEIVTSISDAMVRVAGNAMKPAVQKLFPEQMEPAILLQKMPSQRQAALALIKYAKKNRAQLIAIATHGRRGIDRIALGSFAELILTHSNIPILTVNPRAKVPDQLKTVAFPTDFSPHSKRAFRRAIQWAKLRGAKLKILHAFTFPTDFFPPAMETLTTSTALVEYEWAMAEQEQKKEGEKWATYARTQGIDAEFVFSNQPGSISEKIIVLSNECKADVVILSTAHSPLSIAFLGGTVRDVLATANQPVVLMHTVHTK